jgi:hypothetical protein
LIPLDSAAMLAQILCNMTRPSAGIGDGAAATSAFRKPGQGMPVERLARELA